MQRLIAKFRYACSLTATSGFPWHPPSPEAGTSRTWPIRRAARRAIMRQWPRRLRPLAMIAMTLAWPFASLKDAIQSSAFLSAATRRRHPRMQLAWWAWKRAIADSIPPVEALAFRLFEPGAADRHAWLYFWESICLLRQLTSRDARELAGDKIAFARWCDSLGFRHIPTLAVIEGNDTGAPVPLPEHDLIVKPARGAKGAGIEAWRWHAGRFHSNGRQSDAAELAAAIRECASMEGRMLVQPLVQPHPCLAGIAGTGVPAMRIITLRKPDGSVAIGPAMLQAPRPNETVSQSGPFCLVDSESGHVLPPTHRQTDPVFEMPVPSGFDGIELPDWPVLRAMLERAHAAFPGIAPAIGWDVLFDSEGPLLCEANTGLSFYFFQFASEQPTGTSMVGETLLAWIEHD